MNELIEYLEEYLETNSYNEHTALLTRTNLEMIVDSLKKTDKYRWHDLRKNPEDLPSDDCKDDFFTVAVNGTDEDVHKCGGYVMTATYLYDGMWDVCDTLEVIAWRYIETFESEVEDERKEETP